MILSILPRERNQYSRLIDQEFKLRGWSKQMLSEGRIEPITLGDKVIKIKKFLLMNEKVCQLRDSITHNDYVVCVFYLSIILLFHIFFIWKTG